MREARLNVTVVLVYVLALVAWQLAGSAFSVPAFILPSPLAILQRAARSPGALAFHTLVGMARTPPEMIHLMRSLGASRLQIFAKVRLPAAAPHIFGGLKVGITLSMVGAVVGEFIASNSGLGNFLLIANNAFDSPLLFAIVIALSLLSVALFYAIELIEALVLPRPLRRKALDLELGARA